MSQTRTVDPPEPLMSVEIVDHAEAFAALRESWDALLQTSTADSFFLTWEWLFPWWTHMADSLNLVIYTVHANEELVGLAPMVVCPGQIGRLPPVSCLELLGSGPAGSDYLDFIIKRGLEREVCRLLAKKIAGTGRMLRLARLRAGRALALGLTPRLESLGWRAAETWDEVCPYITLCGETWESYLDGVGSQHRATFRRKLRKLNARFTVRLECASTQQQRQRFLTLLFDLHAQRWQDKGDSDDFATWSVRRFHNDVSRMAQERGWLRLFVLWLDGVPAAALYGFRYGEVFYFFQSGFNPHFGNYSVGLVTMGLVIRHAIEEGVREFDLLHGNEFYKRHWAHRTRDLSRLHLYPPGVQGWYYQGAFHVTHCARGAARQAVRAVLGVRRLKEVTSRGSR